MAKSMIEKYLVRVLFAAGTFALLLSFAEGLAQLLGHSLVSRLYAPSRMLEIAATLLLLLIALLLRQIRDGLSSR